MSCYKKWCMYLSLAIVTHVAYYIFFKKKKNEKAKALTIRFSYCMITKSMNRLLFYLNKPRHSLDIYMYVLTNKAVVKALLKLHYRGVRIRIIVDADMLFAAQSGVKRLAKQGVLVRWAKFKKPLRYEFCLADTLCDNNHETPFAMTGYLNWTWIYKRNQAFDGNHSDYIMVTSKNEIVEHYKNQFERLWNWNNVKPIEE